MKLKSTKPMAKKATSPNPLQARYLNNLIDQARVAMLRKRGVYPDTYHHRFDDADDPPRIKKMREAIRVYEKQRDEKEKRERAEKVKPVEDRVQKLRADILFMEPKEALAAVRAFAREAGVSV